MIDDRCENSSKSIDNRHFQLLQDVLPVLVQEKVHVVAERNVAVKQVR